MHFAILSIFIINTTTEKEKIEIIECKEEEEKPQVENKYDPKGNFNSFLFDMWICTALKILSKYNPNE